MDCRVVVEAAVPVYDVTSIDEAVRIAISKTGGMLNPDLNYVEIDMRDRTDEDGEPLPPAFIAADEALVALELRIDVYNVDRPEHASRIARKEIGQRLQNIPLKVLDVEELEADSDTDADTDTDTEADADAEGEVEPTDDADRDRDHSEESGETDGGADGADGDLLPEFEEMVEDATDDR